MSGIAINMTLNSFHIIVDLASDYLVQVAILHLSSCAFYNFFQPMDLNTHIFQLLCDLVNFLPYMYWVNFSKTEIQALSHPRETPISMSALLILFY